MFSPLFMFCPQSLANMSPQLSAIRVIKECRKLLLGLSVADLLLAKGISDLARVADSEKPNARTSESASMPTANGTASINGSLNGYSPVNINGDEIANVMEITPCTPLQEEMLEKSSEGFYNVEMIFEIHSTKPLNVPRLRNAWHQIIQRHSALRAIFLDSKERQGEHDQIILNHIEPNLIEVDTAETQSTLQIRSSIATQVSYRETVPFHKLTVQRIHHGKSFLKLEISHALIEAVSLGIIFQELELAYDGHLFAKAPPQFREYYRALMERAESDWIYWQQYCKKASPCDIPRLAKTSSTNNTQKQLHTSVELPDSKAILPFCRQNGISVANLFHAIWALVLKHQVLTTADSSTEVIFGYLVSDRDMEIPAIEEMIGPLISALICRQGLRDSAKLIELLTEVRNNSARNSGRKYCDVKQIERELGLVEKRLYNTMINHR